MVRTQNTDSEERRSSEFELHEKGYGKRLASIFGLGIGMGVLAAILSLLIGGTSEVAEDATEDTGDVGDAASDATGDADSVSDAAGKATEAAGELGSNLAQIDRDAADDTANDVSSAANDATEDAGESGSNLAQITQDTADDTANDATEDAGESGSNIARGTQDTADDTANDATEDAGESGSNIARGTQDAADNAANAVSGATISEADNSLRAGEWDVNQAIAAKPDNPILFDYSSAELTTQGKQTISELAQEIKQLDSEQVAVKLVGHASKTGNPQSNLVLSQYRADTVAEELRNLGVENAIETEGKGYNEPITNIPADNARQQRTEVKLIRVK